MFAVAAHAVGYDRDPAFTPERVTDQQYPWKETVPNGHIDEVRPLYSRGSL
jgi:hypothetical protein